MEELSRNFLTIIRLLDIWLPYNLRTKGRIKNWGSDMDGTEYFFCASIRPTGLSCPLTASRQSKQI